MPVSWEIRDQVLIVTVVGDWSGGGPASAITAGMADRQFKPGTSLLLDVRESQMNPTETEVISRTNWLASLRAKGLSSRCAVVIGAKVHQYGLARMAQTYGDSSQLALQIFTDLNDALSWLAANSAQA